MCILKQTVCILSGDLIHRQVMVIRYRTILTSSFISAAPTSLLKSLKYWTFIFLSLWLRWTDTPGWVGFRHSPGKKVTPNTRKTVHSIIWCPVISARVLLTHRCRIPAVSHFHNFPLPAIQVPEAKMKIKSEIISGSPYPSKLNCQLPLLNLKWKKALIVV